MSSVSPQTKAAAQELLRRRACRASIYEYINWMAPTCQHAFSFSPLPHQRVLLNELQTLADKGAGNLMCSQPPNTGKSMLSSIIFPTYLLARNPELRIMCVSNSEEVANSFSRPRMEAMKTPEWERLAGTKLVSYAKGLGYQQTERGGYIRTVGATTTISGLRADVIIADDLIKGIEMAQSMTQLNKLWTWYTDELKTRLTPGGILLVVGTRWNAADPHGRLLELHEEGLEQWKNLRLPLLCDDEKNDPLDRKKGQPLWPERFNKERVRVLQKEPGSFRTLYQQNPIIMRGEWVHPRHYLRAEYIPKTLKIVAGIDIAITAGTGDFSVIVVAGMDHDRKVYILDVFRKQCTTAYLAEIFLDLHRQYQFSVAVCDKDNNSVVWGQHVQDAARRVNEHPPLQMVPHKNKDKESRAAYFRTALHNDSVYFSHGPWVEACFDEMASFPHGKHDDFIDAAGLIFYQLQKVSPPTTPLSEQQKDIPRQLVPHSGGFAINGNVSELFDLRDDLKGKNWNRGRI